MLAEMALSRNTAKINGCAKEEMDKSNESFAGLSGILQIEKELRDSGKFCCRSEGNVRWIHERELLKQIEEMQVALDEKTYMETSVSRNVSDSIEEAKKAEGCCRRKSELYSL